MFLLLREAIFQSEVHQIVFDTPNQSFSIVFVTFTFKAERKLAWPHKNPASSKLWASSHQPAVIKLKYTPHNNPAIFPTKTRCPTGTKMRLVNVTIGQNLYEEKTMVQKSCRSLFSNCDLYQIPERLTFLICRMIVVRPTPFEKPTSRRNASVFIQHPILWSRKNLTMVFLTLNCVLVPAFSSPAFAGTFSLEGNCFSRYPCHMKFGGVYSIT